MTLQNRTITPVMISPEIDNLLPIDDDFEEESITCTYCTASNINNSTEELIMEQRNIRIAQETCRQRRMCTYFLLTIYLIIAILYFQRRHQKET